METSRNRESAAAFGKVFCLGQTFRAVHQAHSALNWIYDIRAGAAVRTCAHAVDESNLTCPQIQKRIWADGAAWPPN